MAELQEIINRWVDAVYDERVHRGTGQRPRERRNQPGFKPQTIDERELDILLMEEHERTVSRGCISFLGDSYFHKRLPEGEKVKILIDDFDASRLVVYYRREYLCTATNVNRQGLSFLDIRERRKEHNRELRTRIKAHDALLSKYGDTKTGVVAQIQAAEKKKPIELPRKADVVTFPDVRKAVDSDTYSKAEPTGLQADLAVDIHDEHPYFKTERQKYMWIRRRLKAGLAVGEDHLLYMDQFRESEWYRAVGEEWEERLDRMEAQNEG
jgi:hypothetical protein